jgi:FtsX-like permease family protein
MHLRQTSQASCVAFQSVVVTPGSVVDINRNLGQPGVQLTGLDLGTQRRFGPFILADGGSTSGDELRAGGVFVTQALADAIGPKPGDQLTVEAGGQPGALSASGDGAGEVAATQQLAPLVRTAVAGSELQVLETKRGLLHIADLQDKSSRPFVTAGGVIVALAATAIVANLAVMLAEERRPRLAVLRALGLTRAGLIQVPITEGALYNVAGAIFGIPLGLALGALVVSHSPPGPDGFPTAPAVAPGSDARHGD